MKRRNVLEQMLIKAELPGEVLPGMPLIEIVGNGRVLIEKHAGVCSYNQCEIAVNIRNGCVRVCGEKLELTQMTRDQLVIIGKISSVSLVDWG